MMMSLKPPNPIPINPSSTNPNPFPFPANSLSPLPKTPKTPLFLSQSNPTTTDLSLSNPFSSSSQDQALLTLLRQRKTDEAWSLYSQCLHLPSSTCLSRLVSQLSYQNTTDSLKRAQSIISRLRRDRHLSRLDSNSLGLLAGAAAKAGHVRYAAALVKSMLRSGHLPHLKSWSAVVSRLSNSPDDGPAEALRLFRTVCRRISSLPDPELASDSKPDTAAFNAALNAAANSGDGEAFRGLFEEMPRWVCEPDVLSYNVMIKLAAGQRKKEALPKIVEAILHKGVAFCVTTIHSLVAAYVGFGDLETAERIVQGMRDGRRDILEIMRKNSVDRKENDEADDDVFEKMLSDRRGGEEGDYLLPKSYPADSRMYTTLMKGYMRTGRVTDTVRMLEAMRCQGGEAGRPDEVSYTTVVTALANAGLMERARQVVAEMGRIGVAANRVTYNALLKGHCKRLEVAEAKEILREMGRAGEGGPEPDVVSYNIVIDGCVSVDDTAAALALFNEMRAKGIAPSKVSYTTLMKAFSGSNQPKLAHKVFDEMLNDPRVKADIVAWNVLVQGYCRLGLVEDAKRIVERMKEGGLSPNVATYGSLANGIALARKPGEALLLWSEVKERCSEGTLKPDEGLLDALADICVRAAFFKKALEIVACMEENGMAPNKTKYTRIYVEMHSRMFTSKHASQARQDRRKERKRAAEAFKFWLGLPNSYYGSEWRLEPRNDYASD